MQDSTLRSNYEAPALEVRVFHIDRLLFSGPQMGGGAVVPNSNEGASAGGTNTQSGTQWQS